MESETQRVREVLFVDVAGSCWYLRLFNFIDRLEEKRPLRSQFDMNCAINARFELV